MHISNEFFIGFKLSLTPDTLATRGAEVFRFAEKVFAGATAAHMLIEREQLVLFVYGLTEAAIRMLMAEESLDVTIHTVTSSKLVVSAEHSVIADLVEEHLQRFVAPGMERIEQLMQGKMSPPDAAYAAGLVALGELVRSFLEGDKSEESLGLAIAKAQEVDFDTLASFLEKKTRAALEAAAVHEHGTPNLLRVDALLFLAVRFPRSLLKVYNFNEVELLDLVRALAAGELILIDDAFTRYAIEKAASMKADDLDLTPRVYNALTRSGIRDIMSVETIRRLALHDQQTLLNIRNFGTKALNEILWALRMHNISLIPWYPEDADSAE